MQPGGIQQMELEYLAMLQQQQAQMMQAQNKHLKQNHQRAPVRAASPSVSHETGLCFRLS